MKHSVFSTLRGLRLVVMPTLVAWLAVAPVVAHAQASVALSQVLTGFAQAPGGGFVRVESIYNGAAGSRVWSAAVGGAMTAADSVAVAGPAGALNVVARTAITAAEAGRVIAAALVSPQFAVASVAAAALFSVYRCYNPSSVPGSVVGPAFLDCDPGQAPLTSTGTRYCWAVSGCYIGAGTNQAAPWSATSTDAANLAVAYQNTQAPLNPASESCANVTYTYSPTFSLKTAPGANGGSFVILRTTNLPDTPCRPGGATVLADVNGTIAQLTNVTVTTCPASTDALNPAYNVPAGGPVGVDGKCATARYNHSPTTPTQAGTKLAAYPPDAGTWSVPGATGTGATNYPKAISDAVAAGQKPSGIPQTITGPATQTGAPTTTTNTPAGGSPTTTTTTPTYNYTYNNTTINYSTTTTTNNGGSTMTTTTPSTGSTELPDPKDPCAANPERIGCLKIGEAPQKEELPAEDVPATYTPTSFASPAACPAPIAFTVIGRSFNVSYSPLCDVLGVVRLMFLATGALAAAFIFQRGVLTV